jgi:uncharacterized Ntn-hydrolase superfamily protein
MKRLCVLIVAFALGVPATAFATWSVIAVDKSRGVVVIASATCVTQAVLQRFPAKDLRDVQAIVVPGLGVAAAQAGVDATRANQRLIFAELQKGTPPDRIIDMLKEDPAVDRRQFGIVDMQGRMAGFSGARNQAVSLDRQGRVPGTDIYYSVQGNILASEAVVTDAIDAFVAARGDLTDRVMAAMEAADAKGGDSRCACDKGPQVNAPCTAKTAHVAYILKAEKGDRGGASFNDGDYTMYLSVTDVNITPSEDANPVKTLRMRYDKLKKSGK